MTIRRCVAALLLSLLSVPAFASESDPARFKLELTGGRVWADGEGLVGPATRRIREVNGGQRWTLRGTWRITERWYLSGSYADARLVYESPLDPACPVDAGYFFVGYYCQGVVRPREGRIHDDFAEGSIALGFRYPFHDRVAGFAELGFARAEWDSDEDVEATQLANCLGTGPDDSIAIRFSRCSPIADEATESGLTAKIGSEIDLGAGFAVALALNYQGFRHEIYRNDILPRFGDENCMTESCRREVDFFSGHSGGDSWTWLSAQLSYALTERVGILLDLEGAGSREWKTASLGLRYSF